MKKNKLLISLLILSLGLSGCSGSTKSYDLSLLSDVMQKDSITGELLNEGETATLENCVVTGIHGNTITVEQEVSTNPNYPEYYSIEAYCNELPSDLDLFYKVNIKGTISLVSSLRVVLTDASIEVVNTETNPVHILNDYYFMGNGPYYYFYSGALTEFYFQLGYEVSRSDLRTLQSMYELSEDVYRAFYVEVYYGDQLELDVADSFILIYDSVEQEAKKLFDAFFDGTRIDVTYHGNLVEAGWSGVSEGDYFFCDAKVQLCSGYWLFNFDNFEARYIQTYGTSMAIYSILSGYFDNRRVNFTGILMDIHSNRVTIESITSDYPGYCIEVYLKEVPDDLCLCTLVSVTGTVSVIDNWWSSTYGYEIPYRIVTDASVSTVDSSDQHMYYFTQNVFSLAWQFGFYNSSFFNVTYDITSIPTSWDQYGNDDLVVWATVHYSAYDSKDYTLEAPIIVYCDQDQNTKDFWHAFFYGTEEDVTISYPILNSDGSKIEPDVTLPAGFSGVKVGSSFNTLFSQMVSEYYTTKDGTYQLTGALSLSTLSGIYLQSVTI